MFLSFKHLIDCNTQTNLIKLKLKFEIISVKYKGFYNVELL